jgi:hypothetical protein
VAVEPADEEKKSLRSKEDMESSVSLPLGLCVYVLCRPLTAIRVEKRFKRVKSTGTRFANSRSWQLGNKKGAFVA